MTEAQIPKGHVHLKGDYNQEELDKALELATQINDLLVGTNGFIISVALGLVIASAAPTPEDAMVACVLLVDVTRQAAEKKEQDLAEEATETVQ